MGKQGTGRISWGVLLVVVIFLFATAALWRPLLQLTRDMARARVWLASLGPWGPIALIVVNALQIILAPIPGYFVQLAGGYMFGVWHGVLCAIAGMLVGSTMAMLIARQFGRPFVQRWLGQERVDRWEQVLHVDSLWVWVLLMAGPVGDIPYYLAGLTRVPLWKMLGIVLIVRGPSVGLAVAAGAGAVNLPPRLLLAAMVGTVVIAILLYQTIRRLAARFEAIVLREVNRSNSS
ncbi:MAG: TVP38/TMEM64 family protein [Anaerolineae bacterium]|nr:TVP38/TMEM64 family protein [Anaerolineae bacterium]